MVDTRCKAMYHTAPHSSFNSHSYVRQSKTQQVLKPGSAALKAVERRLEAIDKEVGDVNARLRASHLSRAQTGRIPNLYKSLLSQELCKSPENIDAVVIKRVSFGFGCASLYW